MPRNTRITQAVVLAACLAAVGSGVAHADPTPTPTPTTSFQGLSQGLEVTTNLPWVAENRVAATGSKSLSYSQQTQKFDEWCWAADGASIEAYEGTTTSQSDFCKAVKGTGSDGECLNDAAQLSEIATAFENTGFTASTGKPFSMSTIKAQIDSGQPIEAGISWTSGGGHARVIYGYDATAGTISYGDPWPTYTRYVTQKLTTFKSNPDSSWFGEVYGISKN